MATTHAIRSRRSKQFSRLLAVCPREEVAYRAIDGNAAGNVHRYAKQTPLYKNGLSVRLHDGKLRRYCYCENKSWRLDIDIIIRKEVWLDIFCMSAGTRQIHYIHVERISKRRRFCRWWWHPPFDMTELLGGVTSNKFYRWLTGLSAPLSRHRMDSIIPFALRVRMLAVYRRVRQAPTGFAVFTGARQVPEARASVRWPIMLIRRRLVLLRTRKKRSKKMYSRADEYQVETWSVR